MALMRHKHPGGYLVHKHMAWFMLWAVFMAGVMFGFILGIWVALG